MSDTELQQQDADLNQVNQESGQESEQQLPSEKEVLLQRAKLMGLKVSNNIGLEALRKKVTEAQEGQADGDEGDDGEDEDKEKDDKPNPLVAGASKKAKTPSLRQYMIQTQMKLVRLRIVNLDPKKKDLPGEVITVANEHLGTVTKFIPFGEVTENGYHVPYCIYQLLKNRRFLNIRTVKDRRTGTNRVEQSMALEFALEVLDPLTEDELQDLAIAQQAAGSLN